MQRNNRSNVRGNQPGSRRIGSNGRRNFGGNPNFPTGVAGLNPDFLGSKMFDMMNTINQVQSMNGKKIPCILDQREGSEAESFPADIIEEKQYYCLEAELPGFRKEDITLCIYENIVTIHAEHKQEGKLKEVKYIQKERKALKLSRSFTLKEVDDTQVKACFEDGILRVVLRKKEKIEKKSKVIQID